jgi:hypothetical protein
MPDKTAADYAECRSLGHSWKHRGRYGSDDPAPDGIPRPFGWRTGCIGIASQCIVCKTRRVKWITRSGEVMSRYDHPEGYSQHGEDKLTAQGWRRSYVSSIFEEFTPHAQAS